MSVKAVLEYFILVLDDNMNEESVEFPTFAGFFTNFNPVLLINVCLCKKACIPLDDLLTFPFFEFPTFFQ